MSAAAPLRWDGESLAGPACPDPGSRAFTHGFGVFETMLGLDGRLVAADRHLARLREGCARLGLEVPSGPLVEAIESALGEGRQRVRLQVSDGGSVTVAISGAGPVPDGVSVAWSPWTRNERSAIAGIKCCSYADNLVAIAWARQRGAEELLFANTRGELCEAAMANVFVVEAGRIATPPLESGCLPGTARGRVLELGFEVSEEALTIGRVDRADEVFLTSATRGVTPVLRVGARQLAAGEVGRGVRAAFAKRWFASA